MLSLNKNLIEIISNSYEAFYTILEFSKENAHDVFQTIYDKCNECGIIDIVEKHSNIDSKFPMEIFAQAERILALLNYSNYEGNINDFQN